MSGRVTPDEKKKMVAMASEGWTAKAIAEKLDRSEDTVRKYLREMAEEEDEVDEWELEDDEPVAPPPPDPEGGRRGTRPPKHVYDDDTPAWDDEESPWGIGGGEFHEILDHVLGVVGAEKKKREMAVNAVRLNHGYHSYDALYQFLVGLKFPVAMIKTACDLTINQYYQQQQQVRGPYGSPMGPISPGPQMPGQQYPPGPGPQTPGFPPQNPGQQQYPPWSGQQPWPGYWPQQQTQERGRTMTPDEIEKMVEKRTKERLAEEEENRKMVGAINSVIDKIAELEARIQSGAGQGPIMVQEPMIDPETGRILRDENDNPIYRNVPYDPARSHQPAQTGMSPYIRQLESQVSDLKSKLEAGPDQEKELLKQQVSELKQKETMREAISPVVSQVNQLTQQNATLQAQLNSQGQVSRSMSEDAQVAVAQLQKQTEVLTQVTDKVGSVADRGMGIVEKMVVGETPETYSRTPQWTSAEHKRAQQWLEGD